MASVRSDGRPDPRLNAYRDDLADARLRDAVEAARFVEGRPARIVVGRAPVRGSPEASSETITFYHYGETVLVFEETAGFAWCQSLFDGYVGYVTASCIIPRAAGYDSSCPDVIRASTEAGTVLDRVDGRVKPDHDGLGSGTAGVAAGSAHIATHFISNMGAYLYEAPDLRASTTDFLPRHCAVAVTETGLMTRGTEYARLDTGGFLPLACLSPQPPRSADIVTAASCYLGCPYLWGGRSFLGIDCSGLVQNAFRDIGITVLRDTDMQRDTIGEAVSVGAEADLRPGDLLYMPGHVLIYAGDGAVIHADGVSMMVRRDNLSELMRTRGLNFRDFIVRRP